MSDLTGEVALVSGAARGTGAAIAQTMAEKIGPPARYVAFLGRGRAERAITEQQVFGRQALAASVPGGDVD